MSVDNKTSQEIQEFIIRNVGTHPTDIGRLTAEKFGLSRVAIVNRLGALIKAGLLVTEGKTKARRYTLAVLNSHTTKLQIGLGLTEDQVWLRDVKPHLLGMPSNVLDICAHGVTEMVNNVIDHSESTTAAISVLCDAATITITIRDYGVGIFHKIQQALHLSDPQHAILELAKGKLTTDQAKHTGEGIFFTSRMFDEFSIRLGDVAVHQAPKNG
ncbi:MAG: hypothetical protein HC938_11970 [Nitrospira sp.]|nr:hypothetical protein [Nitrospira sp.]